MTKCVICEKRPSRNGNGYCAPCDSKIAKIKRNNRSPKPTKFLVYRGNVVGLVPSGNGMLKGVKANINPLRLPKSRTLFLDKYCDGFERSQIKAFKAAVLKLYAA